MANLREGLKTASFWETPYCVDCRRGVGEGEGVDEEHLTHSLVPAKLLLNLIEDVEDEDDEEGLRELG